MLQVPVQRWLEQADAPARGGIASADCAEANAFYEPALLDAALAQFDPEAQVSLLDVPDKEGRCIARLPVIPGRRHGRYAVAHVANWAHPHCYYGAPLLRDGAEEAGWRGLLDALDGADWSGDFLHLRLVDADGPAVRALLTLCAEQRRPVQCIARHERALLCSPLSAEAYRTAHVRAKKRKELRRLHNRLADCGAVAHRTLTDPAEAPAWCEDFLALEAQGWKGRHGTALAASPADAAFFRHACSTAARDGTLDILRIDCDGRAIAMLVNFVGPKGGFSFKIAIDPDFARHSPGVLVEIDNLARVLDDRITPWMDSCAQPDHPMIDSLWAERRTIAQYRVALRKPGLAGLRGRISRFGIGLAEGIGRRARGKA